MSGVYTCRYPRFISSSTINRSSIRRMVAPFGFQSGKPFPTVSEKVNRFSSRPSTLWSFGFGSSFVGSVVWLIIYCHPELACPSSLNEGGFQGLDADPPVGGQHDELMRL